jgi:hypothetical protein
MPHMSVRPEVLRGRSCLPLHAAHVCQARNLTSWQVLPPSPCPAAGTIVYWIVGLNPSAKAFFIFVALLIVEGLAAQALGICISAACKSEKSALALAPAVTVILMLFGECWVHPARLGGLAACRGCYGTSGLNGGHLQPFHRG